MKKYLSKATLGLLLGFLLLPFLAFADDTITIPNPLTSNTFGDLIDKIINILFTICIAIAPIMIIVAGFYFVTSMGDAEKVRKARQMILWTLVGVLIITCAKGIVVFFNSVFGVRTS